MILLVALLVCHLLLLILIKTLYFPISYIYNNLWL
nr:MAG TPA: glycoprotein [Caudoviricetes sp.]